MILQGRPAAKGEKNTSVLTTSGKLINPHEPGLIFLVDANYHLNTPQNT